MRIYLDHAASSPLLPEAARGMRAAEGNPSSLHLEGRRARQVVDAARETLADALGAEFGEVLFTSGGTESCVAALVGVALANEGPRRRIVLDPREHACVLGAAPILRRLGYSVDHRIEDLDESVLIVSAMRANNETGALTDPAETRARCDAVGALWHMDAAQSFLKLPERPAETGADLVSVSAQKVGGPRGVGALYVRAGTRIEPLIAGGGQERELRGGTENVPGIAGFASAVRHQPERTFAAAGAFAAALSGGEITPGGLPGIVHVRFPGVSAESVLIRLDRAGVAASAGAACSSGAVEASHVLLAMGWSPEAAREGVRFSFRGDEPEPLGIEAARRVNETVSAIRRTGG